MKAIISFWIPNQGYAQVGMNNRFVIEDGRIKTLTGMARRVHDIVKRYHKSKLNTPYIIQNFATDEVMGYGYNWKVQTAAARDEWFRGLLEKR